MGKSQWVLPTLFGSSVGAPHSPHFTLLSIGKLSVSFELPRAPPSDPRANNNRNTNTIKIERERKRETEREDLRGLKLGSWEHGGGWGGPALERELERNGGKKGEGGRKEKERDE
jgi:hypothetical protein